MFLQYPTKSCLELGNVQIIYIYIYIHLCILPLKADVFQISLKFLASGFLWPSSFSPTIWWNNILCRQIEGAWVLGLQPSLMRILARETTSEILRDTPWVIKGNHDHLRGHCIDEVTQNDNKISERKLPCSENTEKPSFPGAPPWRAAITAQPVVPGGPPAWLAVSCLKRTGWATAFSQPQLCLEVSFVGNNSQDEFSIWRWGWISVVRKGVKLKGSCKQSAFVLGGNLFSCSYQRLH